MAFKKESGPYTNSGFTSGAFHDKFSTWLTKDPSLHGAGWTLHDSFGMDGSGNPYSFTFSTSTVTNLVYIAAGHNFFTGQEIQFLSTIGPLTANYIFYAIYVDANNIRVATSQINAETGTYLTLTQNGSSSVYSMPTRVYRPGVAVPAPNDVGIFLKLVYVTLGRPFNAKIQLYFYWDPATHLGRGCWSGVILSNGNNSSPYTYYFRGNTDFLDVRVNLIAQTTHYKGFTIGKFNYNPAFVEDSSKKTTLASGATAGINATLQLVSGGAAKLTVNYPYYIYDLNGHTWVDLVKVLSRDLVNDTVVVDRIYHSYPSGSVIGSYPHRYYALTQDAESIAGFIENMNTSGNHGVYLPYGSVQNYCMHQQTGTIFVLGSVSRDISILSIAGPNNRGNSAVELPFFVDVYRNDSSTAAVKCEAFGTPEPYIYWGAWGGISIMVTQRLINGLNYISPQREDSFIGEGSTNIWMFVQDDETA